MNHGPDEMGFEERDPALTGLAPDELALRRMLHSAVDDVEPSDGALDHLRRAVPARRARKRQAAVGMAAAALFIGTAIPALVHVSNAVGSDPNTAMAGQSSAAHSGNGHGKDHGGDTGTRRDDPGGRSAEPGKDPGSSGDRQGGGDSGTSTGSTQGADPSATVATTVPVCTPEQLGSATGSAEAPDSAGTVYGVFRVSNVSRSACTVGGTGTVGVTPQGAADPAKVSAVRHVAGDAAAGLPDPSQEVTGLVLQPGSAYEEKFAFVPSETCPIATTPTGSTTGPDSGGPSPDPTTTEDPGTTSGTDTSGATGTTPQLVTEDGTAEGSIVVTHTTQTGATATATVPGACAGTVYYTGVLAGS
ncbi:hypothetical protein [Streptomyces sp. NK08204]|uniref:hypothetical protein n=1 Tax=Streptomyces sp. NK08204 TaxID=2873260 RepID=UPI001CECA86E|nr:hypothetical protein [Streptomyces sp. NK08204]